ncbi:hypothetical protein ACFOWM_10345 [Ferruginibacter yonginensis]|uniref:Uncharacterized protein n=1 Tax=Ferruginibacter yonginensis TaxID=1310416 RepID=A0ABV8QWF4_9BACT
MSKIKILAVGTHAEILEVVVRLINQNEQWQGMGAADTTQAITMLQQHTFNLVLLCNGLSSADESIVKNAATSLQQHIKVLQHWGGGSGLLYSEIQMALQ